MNLIYLLLLTCILMIAAFSVTFEIAFSPAISWVNSSYLWFISGWVPGLILLVLPIYNYSEFFSFTDALYVLLIHAAFVVGVIVCAVARRTLPGQSVLAARSMLGPVIILSMMLAGIVGQLLYAIDGQLSGNISFGRRLLGGDFQAIKTQYADVTVRSAFLGPFQVANNYLCGIGQVGFIACSVALARKLSFGALRALVLAAFGILFVAMAFNSLFVSGGRLGLILTIMFTVVPWSLPRKRSSTEKKTVKSKQLKVPVKWAVGGIAILATVIYLSTAFVGGRIGRHDASVDLQYTHRARFTSEVERTVGDNRALRNALFQASYLSTPLPTLTYYLHIDDRSFPDPQRGNLNFSLFYQLISKAVPGWEPDPVTAYRTSEGPLVHAGHFGNVWTTMLREIMIDFGKVGAVFFFVIFGFVAASANRLYFYAPSIERGIWLTLVRCQLLFAGFHTLIPHRVFGFAFIVCTLLLLVSWLFSGGIRPFSAPIKRHTSAEDRAGADVTS